MDRPPVVSRTTFFAGSLGTVSAGILFGLYRVNRLSVKENLLIPKHISPSTAYGIAAKALIYGTALCVGSFAGVGAIFAYTSKITTLDQFAKAAKSTMSHIPFVVTTEKQYEDSSDEKKAETIEIEKQINEYLEELFVEEEKNGETKKGTISEG